MKMFFISERGDCMNAATAMLALGHEVGVYIPRRNTDYMGLGIVDRIDSWKAGARGADTVFLDGHHPTISIAGLAERCDTIVSANSLCTLLENDRTKQTELFEKAHLITPARTVYATPTLALDTLKDFPSDGLFLKAANKLYSKQVAVCTTEQEFLYAINLFPGDCPMVVEHAVPGEQAMFSRFFNEDGWDETYSVSVKSRSFQEGVTAVGVVQTQRSTKTIRALFNPLKEFLSITGYVGMVHFDAVLSAGYPIVVDIKFGLDSLQSTCELFNLDKKKYTTGIILSAPEWPHGQFDESDRGRPIIVKNDDLSGICLQDVYKGDTVYYHAACHGVIATVLGSGRNARGSTTAAVNNMKRIDAYEACWSSRGVSSVQDQMKVIVKMGLA